MWREMYRIIMWPIIAAMLACLVALAVHEARAAEGPVDSLVCLARAAYYEARNQSPEAQRTVAETFISRWWWWGVPTPCRAVALGSQAQQKNTDKQPLEGGAWIVAQTAALAAWGAPSAGVFAGKGPPLYFIDISHLKRPGFDTIYLGQIGDLIFFTERAQGGKP